MQCAERVHEKSFVRTSEHTLTPDGVVDAQRGVREFNVGTGGESVAMLTVIAPNSEVRGATFGAEAHLARQLLRLGVRPGGGGELHRLGLRHLSLSAAAAPEVESALARGAPRGSRVSRMTEAPGRFACA